MNFVNFLYYEYALRHHCRWVNRARVVPDPVDRAPRLGRAEARRMLNVPEDGRYLGMLGAFDGRKAIPELLAAFRAAKLDATDRLLLAGRLNREFRALINSEYQDLLSSQRLILIDRFLTDNELAQGYGALDLVCATYRNFPQLSSLMLKGIAAGRPIVAHDFGWPRAIIKRFRAGYVGNMFDTSSFAQTLRRSLEDSADYTETVATKRLLEFHNPSNFNETMLEHVRRAAGKAERHPLRTWDWVLEALEPQYRTIY